MIASFLREKKDAGVALIDIGEGKAIVFEGALDQVFDLFEKVGPKTVILPEGQRIEDVGSFVEGCDHWMFEEDFAKGVVKEHFGKEPDALGLYGRKLALRALGALVYYLKDVLYAPVAHIKEVSFYVKKGYAQIDAATARHLELVRNLREGTEEGTLFQILNRTLTPMGARKLREAILHPLLDASLIKERLNAVHVLAERDLTPFLKGTGDLARIVSRIESGLAKPRELLALKEFLKRIPKIKAFLEDAEAEFIKRVVGDLAEFPNVVELIDKGIEDDPDSPFIIKNGFDEELDRLKGVKQHSDKWLKEYEQKERERTGIPTLKVRYNKVFGYYIEVTKAHLDKIPAHYERKQTLVNAERFITPELKRVEQEILSADERIQELEGKIYKDILAEVASYGEPLRRIVDAVGTLDFLNSLARVAVERKYVKPKIVETGEIIVKGGRHPVVEWMLQEGFVPNDTVLKPGEIHIITGPNMSGKSTYVRQVALIVLLAQIGSFVPAGAAVITPVDRIMTRIGTADNLAQGQSTFMVEMAETANILNNATEKSLIVLDEVGRGTSTYDGLAIAWATAEYIATKIKAKTLFATHYHELTSLAQSYSVVKNYRVDVKEWKDRVIFTHRLVPGGADKSYGIYVAQLAGVPEEVVERAKAILAQLESRSDTALPLHEHPAIVRLKMLNLDKVTPLEALMILEELKRVVQEGKDEVLS